MGIKFQAVEATRENVYAKLAFMGASGSGKSYSALKVATGMLEQLKARNLENGNGKILLINTEKARGKYYAREFKYDLINVEPPYLPETFVEAIEYAVGAGYPIAILDSSTHEWEGSPGGCLDLHQQAGGTFQSWGKVTPRHNKFINAIAESNIHLIVTMRGKDQYEVDNSGPKAKVTKLGVGAQQRNGFEFDFTSTFMLENTGNLAFAQKDNTHIFENLGNFRFDEKHGKLVIDWANDGSGYNPSVKTFSNEPSAEDVYNTNKAAVIELCKTLGGQTNATLMAILKEYNPSGNPNAVKDYAKMSELLARLNVLNDETKTEKEN
jgi:hypothetical protein